MYRSNVMKRITGLLTIVITMFISACSESRPQTKAVYMLLDTLSSGDSLALARIDSASFSEKDIIAKVTFDLRPTKANAEKRAFLDAVDQFAKNVKGSSYTDITGGMLQAIEYLNETGAGTKYILVFSDLKEEVKKGHIRDFPITFGGIKVVALNVTKLRTDNIDPREYMKRVDLWSKRVEEGNGSWRVINDLDRMGSLLD